MARSQLTIREGPRLSHLSLQRAPITSIGELIYSGRPSVPPRTSSRMQSHSNHDPPPPYSRFDAVEESETGKGVGGGRRTSEQTTSAEDTFTRRGGLGCLALVIFSVLCALGLVLGLALGLTIGRRKSR